MSRLVRKKWKGKKKTGNIQERSAQKALVYRNVPGERGSGTDSPECGGKALAKVSARVFGGVFDQK